VSVCNILEESKEYVCYFIKSIPKDCIAIKFSGLQCDDQVFEIGEIEGVPRLIDIGIYENFYSMMNFIDVMNGLLTSEKIQQKASVMLLESGQNLINAFVFL
jgi:hydroxylamine reductase (hybrid-cluster protein)